MIIGELHDLVYSVLKVVDYGIVVPKDVSIRLYALLDETLAHSKVLNHETQASIHRVVLLELFVHRSGAFS